MQGTQNFYNLVAQEWNEYKQKPLPAFNLLMSSVNVGKVCLDVGTGNGRHLKQICEKFEKVYAIDNSEKLLEIAKQNHAKLGVDFKLADVTLLPFSENFFDAVFCIAVLHHLSAEDAVVAFNEFHRVLKPGGLLLGSVWNKHQPKFENISGKEGNVGWKMKNSETVGRFVHFFEKQEIEKLASDAGFEIVKLFHELKGNEHKRRSVCDSVTSSACAEECDEKGAGNLCFVIRKV
ncbi:MAG: methyltransferase domain-containing protein [Candidatus Micrarchaeota archaeon]